MGDSDVAVKVIRVGVCGTDREIIHGQIGHAPSGSDELVIGHEVIGRVIGTGDGITDLGAGDLVTITVRRPDGCPACRAGQPDMCLWGEYTERGIAGRHGYMTEYVVEDRAFVVPIPESLEHVGVLTEPLTVVAKGLRQANLIQQRMAWWKPDTAVVLGAGPIGLLGTLLLRAQGMNVVTVARSPEPNQSARIVKRAGAEYVSTEDERLEHLHARLPNIDLIFESTGASRLAFDAMMMLGTNGVLVLLSLTGGTRTGEIPIDAVNTGLVAGNKTVVGSINAGFEDFTNAVTHLQRFEELWPGLLDQLFTDRMPFDGDIEAIASKPEQGIKTLIEFQG
jgi:threonine dehydrogenase-like Zn-dependent dehydrogenase